MAAKQTKSAKNIYKITGTFKNGTRIQTFTKEVYVNTKQNAEEYVYSILGSKHKAKRKEITISKVEEISAKDVTDSIIKQLIGGK
jgi:large subunit ribosomal protein LX